MQPRSSFDRALLIPVLISIVSILGICLIFWTNRPGKKVVPPTATPFSISALEVTTRPPSPSATSTRKVTPPTATQTPSSTSTVTPVTPPTPSATSTPERIQPLRDGKYDDTDPNIAYGVYWTALKNPSTANSYKGTIHASNAVGDEASFRFTGKRFSLGYQRGRNFGTVTVIVDDQTYNFQEEAFDFVWRSPLLSPGDHFVRIIHQSGESINLDYIVIVE